MAGAQARIRRTYPVLADRPRIEVLFRRGTYYNTTVQFSPIDSGATAAKSIVYAAAQSPSGNPEPVTISGGVDLNDLSLTWEATVPNGVFRAKIPSGRINIDVQHQLFIQGKPLVRARVPNGRPWVPMDGFNLTAGVASLHPNVTDVTMPNIPRSFGSCDSGGDGTGAVPCKHAKAVCASTNITQWPIGHSWSTAFLGLKSFAELGAVVKVKDCLEHVRVDRDWPLEYAAQTFGYMDQPDSNHTWINRLDDSQNFPKQSGPWAGSLYVESSQHESLRSLSWGKRPEDVVVHAMADGQWGGVQFRVAEGLVQRNGSDAILKFQYGGWQQSRTALLDGRALPNPGGKGNRYYIEGSLEFLDEEGEWHFDAETDYLYVYPPADLHLDTASLAKVELVLTQTDRVLDFVGSDASKVRNIAFANLTFAYTSAQFFRLHEESSGGDYAVHRGGAVFAENARKLTFEGNTFRHIGGNAIFLSNSVRHVRVNANLFQFIGTSVVSVVGRTGHALGDGRDGEDIIKHHGVAADNGVRLPRWNVIAHNVIADWGVWDKQSAAFHRALAPDNDFLNNVAFNASRHAVNYQDSMGGGGSVAGNVVFNLNRETMDTTAFNSWGRRTYLISDADDPAVPRLVPNKPHSWHRNLVLNRNYYSVGYQDNGNALRCDDGASWFNMTSNVMYNAGMQWNGGSQVYTYGNVMIKGGWTLTSYLDVGGSSYDTFVDNPFAWAGGPSRCDPFFEGPPATGEPAETYRGDHNVVVQNSTGRAASVDWSKVWCGAELAAWQRGTKQDAHTKEVNGGTYTPEFVLKLARQALYKDVLPAQLETQPVTEFFI